MKHRLIKNFISRKLITLLTICLLFGCSALAVFGATPTQINSSGRIAFVNNAENPDDDVLFDSDDLKLLDAEVTESKVLLSTSLNKYPSVNVQDDDTFVTLTNAIDNALTVPDIYYYDKASSGASCKRYILENGNYYPCDENGVKTSNTALAGTIAVVDKNDMSSPANGETHLVKYSSITPNNLNVGYMGFIPKNAVLGNGADVAAAYSDGWIKGQEEALDNVEIEYERHVHVGDSSTNGGCYTQPVYHKHSGNSSISGGCYTVKKTGTKQGDCPGGGNCTSGPHGPDTSNQVYYVGNCTTCGAHLSRYGSSGYKSCSNPTTVSYTYYELGCGKNTSTIESYALTCGLEQNQIVGAYVTYK